MDWVLHDNGLRHKRVKQGKIIATRLSECRSVAMLTKPRDPRRLKSVKTQSSISKSCVKIFY